MMNKDLLFRDLCARLPYGVKVKFKINEVIAIEEKVIYNVDGEYSYITDGKSYLTLDIIKTFFNNYLDEIKPYLFPLSSMTEEQKKEYDKIIYRSIELHHREYSDIVEIDLFDNLQEFYHKNHLDYRGLIPLGLAINATGLNIY